jgi:choline dehydrogenase
MPLPMGKVLGGGSSINLVVWSHGHKNDWFLRGRGGRYYESVLNIYRHIEDWHGVQDSKYPESVGRCSFSPRLILTRSPLPCRKEHVRLGFLPFEIQNGSMMEGDGGCSIHDMQVRDGKRQSIFRSYVFPYMNRANITVLTHAFVSRVIFEGRRATGVEIIYDGKIKSINAGYEIVLSVGAIQTPKVPWRSSSVAFSFLRSSNSQQNSQHPRMP